MVGIHHHTEGPACAAVQLIAQIERLRERVHAGAVGAVHRVQRLDRERHARRARVIEHLADAVPHHRARPGKVFRAGRQAPGDEHQAPCLECCGGVDRAQVVVDRSPARLAVRGRKHASTAKPRDREAVVADCLRGFLHAHLGELVAPG